MGAPACTSNSDCTSQTVDPTLDTCANIKGNLNGVFIDTKNCIAKADCGKTESVT